MHSSDAFISKYSELVYNGFWFSPEREALQALVTETQRDVAGVASLKLGRRYVGIDMDAKYLSLADKRLQAQAAK